MNAFARSLVSLQTKESCYTAGIKKPPKHSFKWLIINVENIGVEPMTSCMPCKRSSQLS